MAETRLLVDSDVFILFAAAGVMDRVARLLDFDATDVRRLEPLSHQLEHSKKFREKYPDKIRAAALAETKRIQPLTDHPKNDATLQRLTSCGNIDIHGGEAFLFATLAEQPTWLLTTGDRKSLIALATDLKVRPVRTAVAGRVICLETALRVLVLNDGVEAVGKAFRHVRECNKSLSVFFSDINCKNQDSCLEGLDSYIRELNRQVGDDFLYKP